MERTSKEPGEGKPSKRKETFDWQSFGMQLGIFVLQGACFALGGLAVSGVKDALVASRSEEYSSTDKVIPLRKVTNA
jgi:hypothetical protein